MVRMWPPYPQSEDTYILQSEYPWKYHLITREQYYSFMGILADSKGKLPMNWQEPRSRPKTKNTCPHLKSINPRRGYIRWIFDFLAIYFHPFQPCKHINRPDVHFRECEPFLTEVFEGSAEMIDGFVVDDDKTVVGVLELFYLDGRKLRPYTPMKFVLIAKQLVVWVLFLRYRILRYHKWYHLISRISGASFDKSVCTSNSRRMRWSIRWIWLPT